MVLSLLVLKTDVHRVLDTVLPLFVGADDEKYQLLRSIQTAPVSHVLPLQLHQVHRTMLQSFSIQVFWKLEFQK